MRKVIPSLESIGFRYTGFAIDGSRKRTEYSFDYFEHGDETSILSLRIYYPFGCSECMLTFHNFDTGDDSEKTVKKQRIPNEVVLYLMLKGMGPAGIEPATSTTSR